VKARSAAARPKQNWCTPFFSFHIGSPFYAQSRFHFAMTTGWEEESGDSGGPGDGEKEGLTRWQLAHLSVSTEADADDADEASCLSIASLPAFTAQGNGHAAGGGPQISAAPPPRDEGRTADFIEEEEADKGPGEADLPERANARGGGTDVDSMLRDDRDRPRESVSLQLGNSDRYEGEVLDGLMDGRGHYTFADGNVYVGEWRRGKKEGSGTFSWSNGDVYDGEWVDGKMSGRGRIVLEKKLTYDGEWRDGKCNGQGHCRYHNGDKFVGQYSDGKRQGFGKLSRSDGNVYEGTWHGTSLDAHGTCEYADGSKYNGAWKASQREGAGTHHYYNRWVYEGEWAADRRSGHGRSLSVLCTVLDLSLHCSLSVFDLFFVCPLHAPPLL